MCVCVRVRVRVRVCVAFGSGVQLSPPASDSPNAFRVILNHSSSPRLAENFRHAKRTEKTMCSKGK